jgi:hypothetical protein
LLCFALHCMALHAPPKSWDGCNVWPKMRGCWISQCTSYIACVVSPFPLVPSWWCSFLLGGLESWRKRFGLNFLCVCYKLDFIFCATSFRGHADDDAAKLSCPWGSPCRALPCLHKCTIHQLHTEVKWSGPWLLDNYLCTKEPNWVVFKLGTRSQATQSPTIWAVALVKPQTLEQNRWWKFHLILHSLVT